MGDTFGGTWNRPGSNGNDRQRGRSQRQLQDRASFDNEPKDDCLTALFLWSVLATTAVAAFRRRS